MDWLRGRVSFATAVSMLLLIGVLIPATSSASLTHFQLPFSPITGSETGVTLHVLGGVDVDEANSNLFLYDGGNEAVVDIFGAEGGTPVGLVAPFQILGFTGSNSLTEVAIDNAGASPSKGTLYVAQTSPVVKAFVRDAGTEQYVPAAEPELVASPPFVTAVGIAVNPEGHVFVADTQRAATGSAEPGSIVEFSPSGGQLGEFSTGDTAVGRPSSLAFDAAGNLFVQSNSSSKVFKYAANGTGEVICGVLDKNESCNPPLEIAGASGATGVAVDRNANVLYVALGDHVNQYDASNLALQGDFGSGVIERTQRLAVNSATGHIYVSNSSTFEGEDIVPKVLAFGPAVNVPDVVTGTATGIENHGATIDGTVDPSGEELTECRFEYGPTTAYGQSVPCAETTTAIGSGEDPVPVHADLSGLASSASYHFRLTAKNTNTPSPRTGADKTFTTFGPLVKDESVSEIGDTTAKFEAQINPQGQDTTYRFEYVTEAHFEESGFAGASVIPSGVVSIGDGGTFVAVSQQPSDLLSATGYRFRVVAENDSGSVAGLGLTFTTYATPISGLPEGRVYEQATPIDKDGSNPSGTVNVVQAAVSAGTEMSAGITFASAAGFPGGEGAQDFPSFLASRAPDGSGWATKGLFPPATPGLSGGVPLGWSEDLSVSLVTRSEPGSVPAGLFWRDPDRSLHEIAANVGVASNAGFSEDNSKVAFESNRQLLPEAVAGRSNVYVWDRGTEQLQLAGVFNDNSAPSQGSLAGPYDWFGAAIPGTGTPASGGSRLSYATQAEHAISVDGDRVFFTVAGEDGKAGQLYMRENPFAAQSPLDAEGKCTKPELACTIRVSSSTKDNGIGPGKGDPAGPRPAAFMAATPDGSKAFFTSSSMLTDDANTGPESSVTAAIGRAEIGGGGVDLSFLPTFASGIAVSGGWVYWVNPREETINRAKLNGSGAATEIDEGFITATRRPQGVAVDSGHVYWTNAGSGADGAGTIGRAKLDGSDVERSFITGANNPQGIAVNATHVYWTNVGALAATRKIGRANINGTEVNQALTVTNNVTPVGGRVVGVALTASKIYWTRNATTIASANLDGTGIVNCVTEAEAPPAGVAVDGSFLYWANSASSTIGRAELSCASPNQSFIAGTGKGRGLAVDAEHIYFSANQEGPVNPGNDLYRYDAESGDLIDIAPDSATNGAEVRGVLGASEDGSSVYYAANGVPDGAITNNPNPEDEAAEQGDCTPLAAGLGIFEFKGTCNLYLWRDDGTAGGATTFVARLDIDGGPDRSDAVNWQPTSLIQPRAEGTGRVSADGVVLFRSQRQLTAYDNQGVPQLYRYDPVEGLSCVSCNPTGAEPVGAPSLQSVHSEFEMSVSAVMTRNLSSDGTRVFFDSADALVTNDTNGSEGCPNAIGGMGTHPRCQDVYEWVAENTGSCGSEAQNGGCLHLISSGKSPEPSFFADASASGDDAFFFTEARLVSQDRDDLIDIYDARVGGGIDAQNEPPPPPPCDSREGCGGPVPLAPPSESPGSANFSGPGNPTPKPPRCAKGKHRVKGRCVKKHAKKKRHHRRAGANRRSGR